MSRRTYFKFLILILLLKYTDGRITKLPHLIYLEYVSEIPRFRNLTNPDADLPTKIYTHHDMGDIGNLNFICHHNQPIHWVFECPGSTLNSIRSQYAITTMKALVLQNDDVTYVGMLRFVPKSLFYPPKGIRRREAIVPTNFSCSDSDKRASSVYFSEMEYITHKPHDKFWFYYHSQIVNSSCNKFTSLEATGSDCPVYINFDINTGNHNCSEFNWATYYYDCRQSLDYCMSLVDQDPLKRRCLRQDILGTEINSSQLSSVVIECYLEKDGKRANVFAQLFSIPQQNSNSSRIYTSLDEVRLDPNILVLSLVAESKEEFYTGEKIKFKCSGFQIFFAKMFRWFTKYTNGSEIYHVLDDAAVEREHPKLILHGFFLEKVDFHIEPNISEIRCEGFIPNLGKWKQANYKLPVIINSQLPSITNFIVLSKQKSIYCKCSAVGPPDPAISIKLCNITVDENNATEIISCETVNSNDQDYVHIANTLLNGRTHAACVASNMLGNITEFVGLPKPDLMKEGSTETGQNESSLTYAIIGTTGVSFFIGSIIFIGILGIKLRKRRLKVIFLENELVTFFEGIKQPTESSEEPFVAAYNRSFEISQESIVLHEDILGCGQFGIVVKGTYNGNTVAVKTLRDNPDVLYLRALLAEIKILSFVGQHKHIVNLVGAYTEKAKKLKIMLILDFCEHGSLLKFLRSARQFFIENGTDEPEYKNYHRITTKDLVRFSCEVADAMGFIAEKNIIHGDIAARNVLVTGDISMKLCDFGLAKQMSDYQIYVQKKQIPMPVKWMAIESLSDLKFSIESDAWAYGILLWEIFSLAESPYAGMEWGFDSWRILETGYRMEKPKYSSDEIYHLMRQCWLLDPRKRPTFREILEILQNVGPCNNMEIPQYKRYINVQE